MFAQDALYRPGEAWNHVADGLPLIALLIGYRDAGNTARQATASLFSQDEGKIVASFNPDALLDYRARRPVVEVTGNEVTDFREPELELRLMQDSLGQPYLLLHGYEPDFRWNVFTDAVMTMIEQFRVDSVTWAHAIPMPVPHTRPIRLSATGNREDLVEQLSVWQSNIEAPAHALHQLEFRLMEASVPVLDLIVLVPHYLADGTVPAAGLRLLEAIGTASGRMIETQELRERDRVFRMEVDAQIASNEEVQHMIELLESQHDGFVKGTPQENPFADAAGEMPSADAIAAELERYLSARQDQNNQDQNKE